MKFVNAINAIHINIWAMLILTGGVIITCCHHADIGSSLIVGGFALLRDSTKGIEQGVTNGTQSK